MGQLHNELNPRTNLSKAVRAILGSLDMEGGLERFSETLSVEMDLWSRVEWALPRGETIWEACPSAGAVAGNISWVAIRNPTGSSYIVVVDGYRIVGQAGAQDIQVSFQVNQPFVSVVGNPFSMDTRKALSTTAANNVAQLEAGQTAAAFGTNFRHHIVPAGVDDTPVPLGIVLAPGAVVSWQTTAVNLPIQVNIRGREYKAQSSEFVV